MPIKTKVTDILENFLERNKDCTVEVYFRNGITDTIIARIILPIDRGVEADERKFYVSGHINSLADNTISLMYDEVLACYRDNSELEYAGETVVVILKNGTKIEFVCVGMRV